MNFFRRAIRYCWRQKIRSIILLLVFTLLDSAALIALSVGHATAEGTDEVKQTVGASIHIEIDSGNTDLYGSGSENEWGTAYQYNGDYITQEVVDAIAKVDGVVNYSAEGEGGYWGAGINFAVLISKELTDKNGLSVGDGITMYDLDSDSENTFEIVGIFSGTEGMSKDAMELGSLDVYVDSAENVQDILETIQNMPEIKDKTFTYSTDTENFDLISNPLSSIQTMVDTAVIVIAVTGAAIIVLLLLLWTRGRKKEAGILMAVGRSKLEIVLQFLTENILIAIPAVAASLGLTALLADKVGVYLVSQTASDITGLSVTIYSADIAVVYGIGALILILAVLLVSITVIRLKPRMILSEME